MAHQTFQTQQHNDQTAADFDAGLELKSQQGFGASLEIHVDAA